MSGAGVEGSSNLLTIKSPFLGGREGRWEGRVYYFPVHILVYCVDSV